MSDEQEPFEMDDEAALSAFVASARRVRNERRAAVDAAIPALDGLIRVMAAKTDQSLHVRALLYSLWNGQPTSLLDVVELDWDVRKQLCAVILGFGFEEPGRAFFYEAISEPVKEVGLWDWFVGG